MLDWKCLVLYSELLSTELEENTTRNLSSTNLKQHNPNVGPTPEDLSSSDNSANEQGAGNLLDDQQDDTG